MEWREFENPRKAQQNFQKKVDENPRDAAALYDLATAQAYLDDYGAAIASCEKALAIDPENDLFLAFIVFAATKECEYEKALEAAAKLIEFSADESAYYVERAIDALGWVDDKALEKVTEKLTKEGKGHVVDRLLRWIWNP